ncbi:hypothetical protein T03_12301 [Trichinella britovi]|uniref:Uncharacterized protein n=1 Tax=Trichinella britovi TaxID=45882 RepID=A0A0V0YUS5_TRIBR|nr:hypothetical protein T03_12301 [Trichinella britovi]
MFIKCLEARHTLTESNSIASFPGTQLLEEYSSSVFIQNRSHSWTEREPTSEDDS